MQEHLGQSEVDFGQAEFDALMKGPPIPGAAVKFEALVHEAINGNGPVVRKVIERLDNECDREKLLEGIVGDAQGKLFLSTVSGNGLNKTEGLYRTGDTVPFLTIEDKDCK